MCDVLLKESGGPFQSGSLSSEPRDTKQILNRQAMLREKKKKTPNLTNQSLCWMKLS